MAKLIVALQDIITDLEHPTDLTSLPVEEAVEQIKKMYGFLSDVISVRITDQIAYIDFPEANQQKVKRALQQIEEATRLAGRGRYPQAIPLFREALTTLPSHTRARRDLGMALMENKEYKAAKAELIKVLQIDHKDAWAYLILGNLYFQAEKDLGSADRYYQSAVDLAPNDSYILNSLASLRAQRGDLEDALSLFERSIAADPSQPNPRYGKALAESMQGKLDGALATLDALFAQPADSDPRRQPVYDEARRLYVELKTKRANQNKAQTASLIEQLLEEYSDETGTEIRLVHDPKLTTDAKVELAWRYERPYHVIKVGASGINAYLVAHEFEHIQMEMDARAAGRNRLFAVGAAQTALAERVLEKDLRKLRERLGQRNAGVEQYISFLLSGLTNQLYNIPLDLFINRSVFDKYPWLRDEQFVWSVREQERNVQSVTDPRIRGNVPQRIFQWSAAMNIAYALFFDELYGNATQFVTVYKPTGMLATGQKLYSLYKEAAANASPGIELELVDQWAHELKLANWYVWQPDQQEPSSSAAEARQRAGHRTAAMAVAIKEGGPTNPDLLNEPATQMAVTMYLIGALKRFAKMDRPEIFEVVKEIGLLGADGLEYGDVDQTYSLRTIPNEQFSGLQLMAIMYVGFRIIEPDLDTGIPFAAAYEEAVRMYEMGL